MPDITINQGASDSAIADWLAQHLSNALAAHSGEIAISLPGGSTPFPILAELARQGLPFDRIAVWPGDDRVVSEDHAASNVGRIRAALEPLGARIVPLVEDAAPPHFALVWLGMGLDGHIASLFPNTDPQPDAPARVLRLTPDPLPPEAPFDRLSLTIPSLVATEAMLFVARGAEKEAILRAAIAGEHDLPVARLLKSAQSPVTCFT